MWWLQGGAVAPGHFILTGEVNPEAGGAWSSLTPAE